MRSRSRLNDIATHGAALLLGLLLGWLALPLWRAGVMRLHQQDYALLVEQCDLAMRDHFQAKRDIALAPPGDGRALAESELGLTVCQDYDLYQKRLMRWGLGENELAEMRLKAIEARATDLDEIVDIHEIRY